MDRGGGSGQGVMNFLECERSTRIHIPCPALWHHTLCYHILLNLPTLSPYAPVCIVTSASSVLVYLPPLYNSLFSPVVESLCALPALVVSQPHTVIDVVTVM
jgi:hypothetical protein